MIQKRRRKTVAVYLAGDLFATLAAFLLAWFIRFELEVPALTKGVPELGQYLALLPIVLILWPIVFYFHGLYQSRRDRSRIDDALTILLAVVVATFVISAFQAWYRPILPTTEGGSEPFHYSRAFMGRWRLRLQPKPAHHDDARWALARSRLDIRRVGSHQRRLRSLVPGLRTSARGRRGGRGGDP